jgi:hypothetical protein
MQICPLSLLYSDFTNANLTKTDLSNASLEHINLQNSNLSGADLSESAIFDPYDFDNLIINQETKFLNCTTDDKEFVGHLKRKGTKILLHEVTNKNILRERIGGGRSVNFSDIAGTVVLDALQSFTSDLKQ